MSGHLEFNPLKYGDVLGLTSGPLSGKIPGMLTSAGLDLQEKANPGISRNLLETANKVAPAVAAAIATFGGSLGAEGGGGALSSGSAFVGDLPVDPAAGSLPAMSGPGAFDAGGSQGVFDSYGNPLYKSPAGLGGFSSYGNPFGGQQQGHMIQQTNRPQGALGQTPEMVPVYPGALSPFINGSPIFNPYPAILTPGGGGVRG